MEGGESSDRFVALEWVIEGFSCWNREIHGTSVQMMLGLELYPKGLSGNGEYIVVRLPKPFHPMKGELVFIAFSGSIMGKTMINKADEEKYYNEVHSSIRYDDLIADMKKNEELNQDTVILRFLQPDFCRTYYGRLVINASDTVLEMPAEKLKYLVLDQTKPISDIRVRYTGVGEVGEVGISVSTTKLNLENAKMIFKLRTKARNYPKILFRTRICLQNGDGVAIKSPEEIDHIFSLHHPEEFELSDFLETKDLWKKDCKVILRIKIIACNPIKVYCISEPFVKHSKSIRQSKNGQSFLSDELMCLYQDQDFSDFQLKCGTVSFPVHRAILSARSPVFKTMLSTDMREAASGCMDIEDLDSSTLCLFLTYLYAGAVEDLQCDRALKLYYAADKYQVHSLKRECFRVLSTSLSISNVCDVLSLGDQHQDSELVSSTHEFILKNYNAVLESEEWESHMEKDPYLLLKTLTSVSKKIKVRKKKTEERKDFQPLTQPSTTTSSSFSSLSEDKKQLQTQTLSTTVPSLNFRDSPSPGYKNIDRKDFQPLTQPSTRTSFSFSSLSQDRKDFQPLTQPSTTTSFSFSSLSEYQKQLQTLSTRVSSLNFGDSPSLGYKNM